MQRSAIVLARTLGYVEARDLDPEGKIYFPDLVLGIAERYRFQKFPQTFEEHDLDKGVEFLEGKSSGTVIQKFVIWSGLITVDTRTSTSDSKAFLEEVLAWAVDKFGLTYKPGSIKRFAYISDITFYSNVPLLSVHPSLTNLAAQNSKALTGIWQEPVDYQPVSIRIGHDPSSRKYPIAPFSIERWGQARFSENKYFSEAPLPTEVHLDILEQFEQGVRPTIL